MPTSIANFDIAGAADRIVTFANEIIASQSARQAEFNEHDRGRATAYLDRLGFYIGVISVPADPLDLPKTHPTSYPIAAFPADDEINAIENAAPTTARRRLFRTKPISGRPSRVLSVTARGSSCPIARRSSCRIHITRTACNVMRRPLRHGWAASRRRRTCSTASRLRSKGSGPGPARRPSSPTPPGCARTATPVTVRPAGPVWRRRIPGARTVCSVTRRRRNSITIPSRVGRSSCPRRSRLARGISRPSTEMTDDRNISRRDLLRGRLLRGLLDGDDRASSDDARSQTQGWPAPPPNTVVRYSEDQAREARTARNWSRGQIPILRPPGAVDEPTFLKACTRCGDCIEACPHDAIQLAPERFREAAGTPMINPARQPCRMCDDVPCVHACEPDVLSLSAPRTMGTAKLKPQTCLAHQGQTCTVCVEHCPVSGAIELRAGKPVIHENVCTGCGVCYHVCPAPHNPILILPVLARPERAAPTDGPHEEGAT